VTEQVYGQPKLVVECAQSALPRKNVGDFTQDASDPPAE